MFSRVDLSHHTWHRSLSAWLASAFKSVMFWSRAFFFFVNQLSTNDNYDIKAPRLQKLVVGTPLGI